METRHHCRCRFWRWLIVKALQHKRIYWLLWGALVALCLAGNSIKELFLW